MTQNASFPDDPERHLPVNHSPLPALEGEAAAVMAAEDFHRVQASTEFQHLKSAFRGFAFPMTVAFLVWYFAYVLLSTFAQDFMKTPVTQYWNVGLLLGLAQFATTFLITWLYIRHANENLDPVASQLRSELEGKAS